MQCSLEISTLELRICQYRHVLSGWGMLNRHLLFFFLICLSNDDVQLLLKDVTDTRNDSICHSI